MKFIWDEKKNEWLKNHKSRNWVGFEEVVEAILNGWLVDVRDYSNPKYLWQKVFYVKIDSYIYRAPFRKIGENTVLITVHPSRKATKFYLS